MSARRSRSGDLRGLRHRPIGQELPHPRSRNERRAVGARVSGRIDRSSDMLYGMRPLLARALTTLALLAPSFSRAQAVPKAVLNQPTNPFLTGFHWRAIGPVGPGGRLDAIAVDAKNPSTYYLGFAVGGVLKTTTAGTTFESIFDEHASSIADIALAPSDPNVVYVATGEANNRQTTSYGDGLYKSTDAGKTFTNVGFKDAQTLGRILVHPRDPNTAWIAVGGHLHGPNAERGVFMTTDGGTTWTKTLYIDENTGATELA